MLYREWIDLTGIRLPIFMESWIKVEMRLDKIEDVLEVDIDEIFKAKKVGFSTFRYMKAHSDTSGEEHITGFFNERIHEYGMFLKRVGEYQ